MKVMNIEKAKSPLGDLGVIFLAKLESCDKKPGRSSPIWIKRRAETLTEVSVF